MILIPIGNPIGNPMRMGIDDTVGNGNEWESSRMGMGMTLIPMGINPNRSTQCFAYLH